MEFIFEQYKQKEFGGKDYDEEEQEDDDFGSDGGESEEEIETKYAEEEYAGYVENKPEFNTTEDEVTRVSQLIKNEFNKIHRTLGGEEYDISKTITKFQKMSTFLFLNPRLVALSISFFVQHKKINQQSITAFIGTHPVDDPADIIRYIIFFEHNI